MFLRRTKNVQPLSCRNLYHSCHDMLLACHGSRPRPINFTIGLSLIQLEIWCFRLAASGVSGYISPPRVNAVIWQGSSAGKEKPGSVGKQFLFDGVMDSGRQATYVLYQICRERRIRNVTEMSSREGRLARKGCILLVKSDSMLSLLYRLRYAELTTNSLTTVQFDTIIPWTGQDFDAKMTSCHNQFSAARRFRVLKVSRLHHPQAPSTASSSPKS